MVRLDSLLGLALWASLAASPIAAMPILTIAPDLTVPDPQAMRLTGLQPAQSVTIETSRRSTWQAQTLVGSGTFTANARGEIDVALQAPVIGSYTGVDPLGLFWSAVPRAVAANDPVAGQVRIRVRSGDTVLADHIATTGADPALVVSEAVALFPGAILAHPRKRGRYPVIIVLGGSEGGASTAREFAPMLAARGYTVLGLPYYDPGYNPADRIKGLPASFTEIPVDRLLQARAWLAKRPEADVTRLGLWGVSKGAEFAAIAATRFDWISAVVAVVPTDVVWEGWGRPGPPTASFMFGGKPLPFVPYLGMDIELANLGKGNAIEMRHPHAAGRAANPDRVAAARIPIETYRGALMVIGGLDDRVWPSGEMARAITETRARAGLSTTTLIYPGVGHALAGPGTTPVLALVANGGIPSVLAAARAEAWRATFGFFEAALARRK